MPRAGLDRAAVIEAAAALADREGVAALTLARLAAELGVKPPSLYNHVSGLPDIERALAIAGTREASQRMLRAAAGKARIDALLAVGIAYRRFAQERPGLYAASLRSPAPDDDEHRQAGAEAIDIIGDVLSGFGLAGDDALHATRGLRAIIHGFVSLEAAGAFRLALDLDESLARLIGAFGAGLAAGEKGGTAG
jgi:AcrR family transcriptional regulator